MISIAWEVGNLLIPVYADSVGLSPSEIGWVLGSFACATFVVRFCTPILLRYVLEWHMIVLSLFLATLAFAVMPFTHNPYALMAAAFLEGLGLGASLPNMMSLVYLFAPPHRIGEAIGLRITALNAGKSIFPLFAGFPFFADVPASAGFRVRNTGCRGFGSGGADVCGVRRCRKGNFQHGR